MSAIRNFEPASQWSSKEGLLSERAMGFTRAITDSLRTLQAESPLNSAVAGTASGTYTATEQAMLNDMKALLNQIRAALIASGQAV
jgi:hypothetical protein